MKDDLEELGAQDEKEWQDRFRGERLPRTDQKKESSQKPSNILFVAELETGKTLYAKDHFPPGLEPVRTRFAVLCPQDGKVWAIKPSGRNVWYLPGGHRDPGETRGSAAVREMVEETGIRVTLEGLLGQIHTPIHTTVVFHGKYLGQKDPTTPEEIGEIGLIDPRDLDVSEKFWVLANYPRAVKESLLEGGPGSGPNVGEPHPHVGPGGGSGEINILHSGDYLPKVQARVKKELSFITAPSSHFEGLAGVKIVRPGEEGLPKGGVKAAYDSKTKTLLLVHDTVMAGGQPVSRIGANAANMAHELGHHVDTNRLTPEARNEWKQIGPAKISDYAKKSSAEHFGEAYRAFFSGDDSEKEQLKRLEPKSYSFMQALDRGEKLK